MFTILSTREIATAAWFAVLIIFCIFSPKIRGSLLDVVKTACTPKLAIPFVCMILYASFFSYLHLCHFGNGCISKKSQSRYFL